MVVRPFVLHEQKNLELLRQRITTVLEQWCGDWGLPVASALQIGVMPGPAGGQTAPLGFSEFLASCRAAFKDARDSFEYRLFSYSFMAEAQVAETCVICSTDVCAELSGQLIAGRDESHPEPPAVDTQGLSVRLLSKLFGDLFGRLPGEHRPVYPEVEDLIQKFASPGSGALAVRATVGHGIFYLLLSLPALQQLFDITHAEPHGKLPHKPKKQDYLGFCPDAWVTMEVKLPPLKTRIADIQGLAVGDVLKLECELDRPLDLYIDGVKRSQQVYLGSVDDTRAIKLQTL